MVSLSLLARIFGTGELSLRGSSRRRRQHRLGRLADVVKFHVGVLRLSHLFNLLVLLTLLLRGDSLLLHDVLKARRLLLLLGLCLIGGSHSSKDFLSFAAAFLCLSLLFLLLQADFFQSFAFFFVLASFLFSLLLEFLLLNLLLLVLGELRLFDNLLVLNHWLELGQAARLWPFDFLNWLSGSIKLHFFYRRLTTLFLFSDSRSGGGLCYRRLSCLLRWLLSSLLCFCRLGHSGDRLLLSFGGLRSLGTLSRSPSCLSNIRGFPLSGDVRCLPCDDIRGFPGGVCLLSGSLKLLVGHSCWFLWL